MGCGPSKNGHDLVAAVNGSPKVKVKEGEYERDKGLKVGLEMTASAVASILTSNGDAKSSNSSVPISINEQRRSSDTPGPDPRRQILTFFNTIDGADAMRAGKNSLSEELGASSNGIVDKSLNIDEVPLYLKDGDNSRDSVFTVWRPCSSDAIRKMVEGQAVGKGLDIKGKSAKAGELSGFVPYLQIHNEDDKSRVQTLERGGRTRIFFASQQARDAVMDELGPLQNHILNAVQDAKRTVKQNVLAMGFVMAAAGRSTSKVVSKASSSAVTSIKSSVSSTGSSVMASSRDLSSTAKITGSGAVLPDKSDSTENTCLSDNIAAGGSDQSKMAASPSSLLSTNMTKITPSLTSKILTLRKHSTDLVTSTADMIASPINDGLRKGASMTVFSVTTFSRQTTDTVVDAANLASTTARSGLDLAASTASTFTKPIHKSLKDLSVKGLGLGGGKNDTEVQWALKRLLWDMDDPSIRTIDDYIPSCYGIELPDRLLWQAFVVDSDISRPEGSKFYNARPSQPAFQDMNFIAISKSRKLRKKGPKSSDPLVVLYQTCNGTSGDNDDPMDPRGLVMAYEECGRVLPVVSDFDCFTMGSKNVGYVPLADDQLELLNWCISNIEEVLKTQDKSAKNTSWTDRWLQVLKSNATKGFHPNIPKYGFGDAKVCLRWTVCLIAVLAHVINVVLLHFLRQSYSIVEDAVSFLQGSGAVRHGAECFNYYFPQELDDEFLIVSELFPEKWRYVSVRELQDFLFERIQEGYTFPLNPKWLLCDGPRWMQLYDGLLQSNAPFVQESMNAWFPGKVRDRIDWIRRNHPDGFHSDTPVDGDVCGTEAMDLALLDLDRHCVFRKARIKICSLLFMVQLLESIRRRRCEALGSQEFVEGEEEETEAIGALHGPDFEEPK